MVASNFKKPFKFKKTDCFSGGHLKPSTRKDLFDFEVQYVLLLFNTSLWLHYFVMKIDYGFVLSDVTAVLKTSE